MLPNSLHCFRLYPIFQKANGAKFDLLFEDMSLNLYLMTCKPQTRSETQEPGLFVSPLCQIRSLFSFSSLIISPPPPPFCLWPSPNIPPQYRSVTFQRASLWRNLMYMERRRYSPLSHPSSSYCHLYCPTHITADPGLGVIYT